MKILLILGILFFYAEPNMASEEVNEEVNDEEIIKNLDFFMDMPLIEDEKLVIDEEILGYEEASL